MRKTWIILLMAACGGGGSDDSPATSPPPDLLVEVSGVGSFRPSGEGERWGRETRWIADLTAEVRVLVDRKDDGQIRVTLERCWSTLSYTAPVLASNLRVTLDGNVAYDAPIRIHHHTRPTLVLRRSAVPAFDLAALSNAGFLPRYDPDTLVTEDTISKIAAGGYPWTRWKESVGSPYDAISEEFGWVASSWTGGAFPKGNEAAMIPPFGVAFLLTGDERLWPATVLTADSSGNYPIHYWVAPGRAARHGESGSLPFIQPDTAQAGLQLTTAAGAKLPLCDVAHQHSLAYLAALLTGERYYVEELAAWNLFNLLSRPYSQDRLDGILWSGQVRASCWSYRSLLHLTLLLPEGEERDHYRAQLLANVGWLTENMATPGGSQYRATGITSISPYKYNPWLDYAAGTPPRVVTWQHHILAFVLGEIVRAGFPEATTARDHVLRVAKGVWESSPASWDGPWGNHAVTASANSWTQIMADTFALRATAPTAWSDPFTPDYVAWMRSALVAALDAGHAWASGAFAWIDPRAKSWKGGPPLDWSIRPE